MYKYTDLAGVIFDIDGTLLDDRPPGEVMGLHERSRMMAAHQVGVYHNIPALQQFTAEQCKRAFLDSKAHVVHAVVWQMLVIADLAQDDEPMDYNHPLVQEIVALKEELHEQILRERGREVPGAAKFIEDLAGNGLSGKMAIASTACRRDIDVFLEMTNLARFFANERIISRENFTHAKPDPECYNLAFATLGLPESSRLKVMAFEDDPRGIMSAKAAGLYVCAITTCHSREALSGLAVPPDFIADSFAEFANLLGLPTTVKVEA